jgi:hypothetical protein
MPKGTCEFIFRCFSFVPSEDEMKNGFIKYGAVLAVLLAAAVTLAGCEIGSSAQVRFWNNRSDSGPYTSGVRCGDAVYDASVVNLTNGMTTEYFSTVPGTYPAKYRSLGSWVTLTGGNFQIEAGKKYTIQLLGSNGGGLSAAIATD